MDAQRAASASELLKLGKGYIQGNARKQTLETRGVTVVCVPAVPVSCKAVIGVRAPQLKRCREKIACSNWEGTGDKQRKRERDKQERMGR